MIINFVPIQVDYDITIERRGDSIVIDGEEFDFSPLPEGARLPISAISSTHFSGNVSRVNGLINMSIRLPHGPNASYDRRYIEAVINPDNGPLDLPAYDVKEDRGDV